MLPVRNRAETRRARCTNLHRRLLAIGDRSPCSSIAAGCRYTADLDLPVAQAESTKVLAADGSLLANLHAEQNRDPVALDAIAPVLRDAVVAIEDARYFDHDGVDPRGMVRALTRDIEAGTAEEGGSTITQQYVRAVMLDSDKTITRKLREAVLAVQLEQRFSKRQILQRYLNTVYFGNGAYGVEAAAQVYFAKSARDVDLPQAALLAGLIQAPNRTDPYRDPAGAQLRRDVVIDRMAELDRIDPTAAAAAKAAPLGVGPAPATPRYPAAHFVERVKKQIVHDPAIAPAIGPDEAARERRLFTGGLRIETTLDRNLQGLAEQAVAQVLPDPATDPEAAVVSIDPTNGHVVAYVGGRDYFGSAPSAQFDLAENDLGRSSGSAFKPFVLAAALDAGIPLTRTYKAPGETTIPIEGQEPWEVANYEGKGDGSRMDLTEATVKSVNTVYAQLMMDVGPQAAVDEAKRLGIVSTELAAGPFGRPRHQRGDPARHGQRLLGVRGRRSARRPRVHHARHDPRRHRALRGTRSPPPGAVAAHRPPGQLGAAGGRHRRNRGEGQDRTAGRGQDRHRRGLLRRLVRGLHPGAEHRGVGRLPW